MNSRTQAALEAMIPTPETDRYALARARALIVAYDKRWADQWSEYEILKVESEFTFPLLNPETEAASRSFVEAGKIDVEVRKDGRIEVVEHKTTCDSIEPDSDYWDRLRMDSQCSKYFIASAQNGEEVAGVIYDVIHKPAQRMAMIPLRDSEGTKIVNDRSGARVKTKDGKKWRETGDAELGYILQTRNETTDEHEQRVAAAIAEAPDKFFGQRRITRLSSDILEFMSDEWSLGQQILYFRSRNLWPRNPGACSAYGRCEFFDLCCGRSTVDGINFRPRRVTHAELTIQSAGELQLLTNSRATALRKCPRYHQHKYETPIERVSAEESEALAFGTLIHRGLETYFNHMKNERLN